MQAAQGGKINCYTGTYTFTSKYFVLFFTHSETKLITLIGKEEELKAGVIIKHVLDEDSDQYAQLRNQNLLWVRYKQPGIQRFSMRTMKTDLSARSSRLS